MFLIGLITNTNLPLKPTIVQDLMSYPVLTNRSDNGPARHQFDARLC